jgi:hypothetical protein
MVLTPREIAQVALDLSDEARRRAYVSRILAPEFVDEPQSWGVLLEMLEVVLHRRGLYIAPYELLKDTPAALKAQRIVKTGIKESI